MYKMTGLEQFGRLLKEFRRLSLWSAGGSIALPFIASFIAVIPPWPAGLNLITAVFQLLALILIYQIYSESAKSTINRNIVIFSFMLPIVILLYMVIFTTVTIYVPETKRFIVIGYNCLPGPRTVFGDKCPFLDLEDLAGVAYDEFLLWTRLSIALTRGLLIGLWILFFMGLAALIGMFIVFQMSTSGGGTAKTRRKDTTRLMPKKRRGADDVVE